MRIDEFEFRNKQGEEIEPTKEQLVIYIKGLHKQFKELEKALELACEKLTTRLEVLTNDEGSIVYPNKYVDYFKTKAKEMKSE